MFCVARGLFPLLLFHAHVSLASKVASDAVRGHRVRTLHVSCMCSPLGPLAVAPARREEQKGRPVAHQSGRGGRPFYPRSLRMQLGDTRAPACGCRRIVPAHEPLSHRSRTPLTADSTRDAGPAGWRGLHVAWCFRTPPPPSPSMVGPSPTEDVMSRRHRARGPQSLFKPLTRWSRWCLRYRVSLGDFSR